MVDMISTLERLGEEESFVGYENGIVFVTLRLLAQVLVNWCRKISVWEKREREIQFWEISLAFS